MKNQNFVPGVLENGDGETDGPANMGERASTGLATPVNVRLVPFAGPIPATLLFFCCVLLTVVCAFSVFTQYRRLSASEEVLRHISNGMSKEGAPNATQRQEVHEAAVAVGQSAKSAALSFVGTSLFGIAALGATLRLLRKAIRNLVATESSLREADQFLRLLVNGTVKQGVYRLDAEGRIAFWNEDSERLTGYRGQEVIGESHGMLYTREDRAAGKPQRDLEAARSTGRYEAECERVTKDGHTLWAGNMLSPLYSASGVLTGFAAAIADISERKRAAALLGVHTQELERSNLELSQFAYVASHDLQEPLRKIVAFGDRLRSRNASALGEAGAEDLSRMQQAALRMGLLIENLLVLSRVTSQPRNFESTDLNKVVKEVLVDLELRIKETGARVEASDLPTIMADGSQMRQLIQNLISNSLKYKKVDVSPVIRVHGEKTGPGFWKIEVSDNGIGFDEKYGKMIFRPFRRLGGNKSIEGSGIGLTICHNIIARHGGQVFAKSKPGEGTTIVCNLPEFPMLEGGQNL